MRFIGLAGLAGAAILAAGAANAQEDTPPNCYWVARPNDGQVLDLWCREADGRAHMTSRSMRQAPPSAAGECPRGQIYDGVRCRREAEVLAGATAEPPRPASPQPAAKKKPRVLVFREGNRTRTMACVDEKGATVCTHVRTR